MRTIDAAILKLPGWLEMNLKQLAAWSKTPEKLAFILIALNLCITVPLAATLNIWFDEAYSLDTSGKNLEYAIHQAINFEQQAPLYFVLLNLWRGFNHSIFFARLLSVLCISLTIYTATIISQKLFKHMHSGWIAAAVAFNPFMIWAAVEVRLFAFSILLSALLLLLFLDGYLSESPRTLARFLYTIVSILALYTHYFLLFSLIAYGIVLLCLGKKRALLSYCLYTAIVGVSFVPVLLSFIIEQVSSWKQISATFSTDSWSQTTTNTDSSVLGLSALVESFRLSFAAVLLYLVPAEIGKASPNSWRLLRFLLLSFLLGFAFLHRHSIKFNSKTVWVILLVLSTIFFIAFEVFIYLGLINSIQSYRHTISLLIPAIFAVFAVFASVPQNRIRKTALLGWMALILSLNLTSIYLTYAPLAKTGDYIRVASYLMANEIPNQPILVFNPEVEMVLKHYYKGINRLIPLPKQEDFQSYNLNGLVIQDEQEIFAALSQVPGDHRAIWLVTDTGSLQGKLEYNQSYRILNEFVNCYYSVGTNRAFYGSNVKLLHSLHSKRTADRFTCQ